MQTFTVSLFCKFANNLLKYKNMILDNLQNASIYHNLHPRIAKAFDYLRNTDFSKTEVGKYEIDGNQIFAMVSEYTTKQPENCRPEAHQQYFDIQYLISGVEKIGYVAKSNQPETEAYNADKDIAFYKADVETIVLPQNYFAVFFPNDLHAPCMHYTDAKQVKKVVVKVLL